MPVPPPHNLTLAGHNATGYVNLMQTVNTNLLQGMLGLMLLIAIFAIAFILSMRLTNSASKAMIVSSFGVFIISIFFRLMEIIPDIILYVCMGIAALSLALIRNE